MDYDNFPAFREVINTSFDAILQRRVNRRAFIVGAGTSLINYSTIGNAARSNLSSSLTFSGITNGLDEHFHLAKDYSAQVLLKWGDSLYSGSDRFDPSIQTAAKQLNQFGYNNDFVAYLPISNKQAASDHGLLVVNHEYVNSRLMHPGSPHPFHLTKQQIDLEIAAHGLTIVEIYKQKNIWLLNYNSKYNRRITPLTKTKLTGPARGHTRVKTDFSPNGESCLGTFGNCAGGVTPWGTVLTAEENIQAYFMGDAAKTQEYENYKRFGLLGDKSAQSIWGKYHKHWNLNLHAQAAMHAGWIVEIDPFDPTFTPIKRTALGRCKHEGCGVHINKDGKIVIYMGDDQTFEYIYRFVSDAKYWVGNRNHNLSLLDKGNLAVAEFTEHGTVIWHTLEYNTGPLTKENDFYSQADVLLDMRKAADLLGATPMDRPEEIKVNTKTGNVFAVLTNNFKRNPLQIDAANPRAINRHGHILEMIPPQQDHSAKEYQWEIFILAGNPESKLDRAYYQAQKLDNGWFSSPDNFSFDQDGNIWIATDGFNRSGYADGIWAGSTVGTDKGLFNHFLRAPIGAEVCSPIFTPDHKTMFCSIQHPGDGSSFNKPSTRWPDFDERLPPRPAVIAVTHDLNEVIGS